MSNGLIKRFKKLVFDILTLSHPEYRILTLLVVLLLLLIVPMSFLQSLPNLSICSRVLGKYCYSVGITRGVSSLLKLNLSQAIEYNPLSLIVLIVLTIIIFYDLIHIFFRK
ncbi:MAG: DUF2752 domain-containing protein, partial [Nanoarchaeota archaeon]